MNVAASVLSQSQTAVGLKAHSNPVKIVAMRSAAPPNLSVLLLIAANISNPRRPSATNASQHPLEPLRHLAGGWPFIHAVILRSTGMLNTSENYGGRGEHRLATRSNILLDLAMDNDQLITLSPSNRRRRVFKAPQTSL
jgi:hypothetical protein